MRKTPFSLRVATPDDADLLFRVYATSRDDELAVVPFTAQEKHAFLRMQFAARERDYGERFSTDDRTVVERDGTPVGYCWVHRGDDELRILDVALLPEHRGDGLDTELMASFIEEAKKRRLAVRIQVLANSPARRRYERLGFSAVGEASAQQLMELVP